MDISLHVYVTLLSSSLISNHSQNTDSPCVIVVAIQTTMLEHSSDAYCYYETIHNIRQKKNISSAMLIEFLPHCLHVLLAESSSIHFK